ncbi:MAG: DoxX family protein [Aeromicrobium sp.]
MTLLRLVARPMLASMFVYGGVNSVKNASVMAPKAQPLADKLEKLAPTSPIPINGANLVRLSGVVNVAAGAALATGHFPRTACLVLAGSLIPSTSEGHQFWKESDPGARANQKIHFLKNLSMFGGLLMATLDPDPHKKFIVGRAKDRAAETIEHIRD